MSTKQTVGLAGAVAIGLASMLGAGVFVVFREGYALAGTWVWAALALAALVASLNSASVYQLARVIDRPGGTYAYARVFIGEGWSFAAGFAFVAGKIGSIAAIALALGEYVAPELKKYVAVGAIVLMTCVNLLGIQRTAAVAAVLAISTSAFLLVVLGLVAIPLTGARPPLGSEVALPTEPTGAVVTAAAIFFFAFAGYARVATLGTEVRDAKRNITRAIVIVMVSVSMLYFALLFVLQTALGSSLASLEAPFAEYLELKFAGSGWLVLPFVAMATLGSILALLAGVSRTAAEMAQDRELPRLFESRNLFGAPWVAEVGIALGASLLVLVAGNLAWAIGFSSFSVLFYYAVAHLSVCYMRAASIDPKPRLWLARFMPIVGILLCLALAVSVPGPAFMVSSAVLVAAVVLRRLFRKPSVS